MRLNPNDEIRMTNQCQNDEYPRRCGIWISDLIRHSSFWFRHFRAGQGLLETTIAIGVITTGLFAVITLVFSNSRSSDEAELRFSAVQLAREGVEIVRAKRDSNWLAADTSPDITWSSGIIDDGAEHIVRLGLDFTNKTWAFVPVLNGISSDDALVRRDNGFFTQGSTGDPTLFHRIVTLTPTFIDPNGRYDAILNPVVSIRVQSEVQWTVRGQTKGVTIEERLYDWR